MASNMAPYSGSVAIASSPIITCTMPSRRIGSAVRSMRRFTQKPPQARPKTKAESINSNECVEAPSTRLSILIQPIS